MAQYLMLRIIMYLKIEFIMYLIIGENGKVQTVAYIGM